MNYDFMDAGQKTRLWCLQAAIEGPYGKINSYRDLTGSIISRADRFHEYVLHGKPPVTEATPAHIHDGDDKQVDAASAPATPVGDEQAESDLPAMSESDRALITRSVETINPLLTVLYTAGGHVELTAIDGGRTKVIVVPPPVGMRHIDSAEKDTIWLIRFMIISLHAMGCRLHIDPPLHGVGPAFHWTMPANF